MCKVMKLLMHARILSRLISLQLKNSVSEDGNIVHVSHIKNVKRG